MEAYITLTEHASNMWELTVKLPLKWLKRFDRTWEVAVAHYTLSETWGDEVIEDSVKQPWRKRTEDYRTLADAEQRAADLIEELRRAVDSLKPKGFVRYVLDLDHDNVPIKDLSREGIPTNNAF